MSARKLYEWQKEAISRIRDKNAVVSAPTGSGKTWVAFAWAFGFDKQGNFKLNPERRTIFTAPIKALSVERYLQLKKMFGKENVGILTGDVKKNKNAPVLCMTQEIYTLSFAHLPDQNVVIDELHYIAGTGQSERARAYVDGIRKTHPNSRILTLSATFGDPDSVRQYLERLTGREFVMYHTDWRPTRLEYLPHNMSFSQIAEKNCLVFVFSYRGVKALAHEIASHKDYLPEEKLREIELIAKHFKVNLKKFPFLASGVGVYHGGLLPKEKFFMDHLFRMGHIQQMVGTDALALGVNLPAEYVVFGQLAKYYDGPITRNEFEQMAGRAGRPGFYPVGYVSYVMTPFEAFGYDTSVLYHHLLEKEQEPFSVQVGLSYSNLLKSGLTPEAIEKEIEYVSNISLPSIPRDEVEAQVRNFMTLFEEFKKEVAYNILNVNEITPDLERKIIKFAADVYFDEFDVSFNLKLIQNMVRAKVTGEKLRLDAEVADFDRVDGRELRFLLQILKFYRSLPKEYRELFEKGFEQKVSGLVSTVDHTILNPEEAEFDNETLQESELEALPEESFDVNLNL